MKSSQGRRLRAAVLIIATVIAELLSVSLVLACLSRPHSPWLWAVIGFGFLTFWRLLSMHEGRSNKLYTGYSLMCLMAVAAWMLLDKKLVLTFIDWIGLSIALIVVLVLMLHSGKKKIQTNDE